MHGSLRSHTAIHGVTIYGSLLTGGPGCIHKDKLTRIACVHACVAYTHCMPARMRAGARMGARMGLFISSFQ